MPSLLPLHSPQDNGKAVMWNCWYVSNKHFNS